MKAEQFDCGPGAIARILVCERARSVTPRALDVSRDKVHVSWFNEGREDMSYSQSLFRCRQNFDRAGSVVLDKHACSHFCACTGAVIDQKANTTLTVLRLFSNKVGAVASAALANALQATVLTCKKCVFRACVRRHHKCRFTKSSAEWASSTFLAGCVPVFVIFFLCLVEKRSLR